MATTPRTDPAAAYRAALGRAVRELRQARDWSQSEAEARAGLTPTYWSHLEAGRKNPSLPFLLALAELLGTTPARLLAAAEKILKKS